MLGSSSTVYVFEIFLLVFIFSVNFVYLTAVPYKHISKIDLNNFTDLSSASDMTNSTDITFKVNKGNPNHYHNYNNEMSKTNGLSHNDRYIIRKNFTKENTDTWSKIMMFKNKPLINLLHVPEQIQNQNTLINNFSSDYVISSDQYSDNTSDSWDKIIDSFQKYDILNDEVTNYTWVINYESDAFQKSWSDIISNLRNSEVFKTTRAIMDNMYESIVPYVTINMEEGRKMKLRRMLFKSLLGMKMVAMGVFLPALVALATLQSWKAVTISLLALGLAAIVGIKNLIAGIVKSKSEPQQQHHHHVHSSSGWHSGDSSWGRSGDSNEYRNSYNTISYWDRNNYRSPHEMAYSGYYHYK